LFVFFIYCSVIPFFIICCFSSSCCHKSFHICFIQRVVKSCLYPNDMLAFRSITYAGF
jgi:hypothetical protein